MLSLEQLSSIPTPQNSEQRLLISGTIWDDYEQLLERFAEASNYRCNYLEGILEIVSPSRSHEFWKKNISRLLEIYLEAKNIPFWGLGSTTIRDPQKKVGKEPDESYCLYEEKELPDLAIEVVISSGGLDSLTIYQRLQIPEIWFWQNNRLIIYCLNQGTYQEQKQSQLLPELDLELISQYIIDSNPLTAVKQWRKLLVENND